MRKLSSMFATNSVTESLCECNNGGACSDMANLSLNVKNECKELILYINTGGRTETLRYL